MRRLFLILFFCSLPVFTSFAQSSRFDSLETCGHDLAALQSAIQADGWRLDDLIQLQWSPNCRYLSMRLPASHGDPGTTIVWNAAANRLIGSVVGFSAGGQRAGWWDSTGDYLVVPVWDVGTYLWYVPANRQMLINEFSCGIMNTYWDYQHLKLYATAATVWGENWCSPYINVGGLRVYDLNTGATLATYEVNGYTLNYEFAGDGRYLVITDSYGPVQVYDTTSGQQIAQVDINQGGGVIGSSNLIEVSPDGHYLAVGWLYLRIWDLTTLPKDLDAQQPTYRYGGPNEYIEGLHFAGSHIIETTTWKGTQQWDVTTGAEIP